MNIHCVPQSRGMSSHILNTHYSIGYLIASEARDSALPDARLLNRERHWVRPSVATTQAAMNSVSGDLNNHLTASLVNTPGALSYPIAGYTYILIRKVMDNCTVAMEMYRMFSYFLEDTLARTIVADMINAPISEVVLRQVKQRALDEMKCQGVSVKDLVAETTLIENGSYDAWKLPVIIVSALLGLALVMLTVFSLYVKYTQNRSALHNTFVIELNFVETTGKPVGSMPALSMNPANPSPALKGMTHDATEGLAAAHTEVLKVTSGEQFLARKLCGHFLPETIKWATKLTLVKMTERINHVNILPLIGVSLHDHGWKLINAWPSRGRLRELLHAGKYHTDAAFRYSILTDIADGVSHLHRNGIVHGQLTSNNCYIDASWSVVVSDWEQYVLHQAQKVPFVAFEAMYNELNNGKHMRCTPWFSPYHLFTV